MLTRVKTFAATGLATAGRIYAGDLNAIQDAVAAISDFAQTIGASVYEVGESGLSFVKYATGEIRATGGFRADGKILANGGFYAGTFTTSQRNAITSPPTGLVIWNSDTVQYEHNKGTSGSPNWQPLTFALQSTIVRRAATIAGATYPTAMPFDTEDKDDTASWAIGTPTKVFIPVTGTYEVIANAYVGSQTGSGGAEIGITRYSAADALIKTQAHVNGGLNELLSCSAQFLATAGQYIRLDYGMGATGAGGLMTADMSVTRNS